MSNMKSSILILIAFCTTLSFSSCDKKDDDDDDDDDDAPATSNGTDSAASDPTGPVDPVDDCNMDFTFSSFLDPTDNSFIAQHITNYDTEFTNFSITPLTINNMRAGTTIYPGVFSGQVDGNTGTYRAPLPGYYDIASIDDKNCKVVKRYLVPGFYIVDHDLKIGDSDTRLDFIANDVTHNMLSFSIGSNWNEHASGEELRPALSFSCWTPSGENVLLHGGEAEVIQAEYVYADWQKFKTTLRLPGIASDYDLFPGSHILNNHTEETGYSIPDNETDRSGGSVHVTVNKTTNFSQKHNDMEDLLNQAYELHVKYDNFYVKGQEGSVRINGSIVIVWVGNSTTPQESNLIN